MRTRGHLLLLVPLVALLAGACSEEETALLDLDYRTWERTTDATLDFAVPGHGSGLRRIYASPEVFSTRRGADGSVTYPSGSIVVKEVYSSPAPAPDEAPAMLTAMIKDEDDPRALSGWVWVVRDVGSGVERVFTDTFCVTCHVTANEPHPYGSGNIAGAFHDYIFHTPEQR